MTFDIWYVVLPRGPLTRVFKLCHWGEKGPQLEGMEVGGFFAIEQKAIGNDLA